MKKIGSWSVATIKGRYLIKFCHQRTASITAVVCCVDSRIVFLSLAVVRDMNTTGRAPCDRTAAEILSEASVPNSKGMPSWILRRQGLSKSILNSVNECSASVPIGEFGACNNGLACLTQTRCYKDIWALLKELKIGRPSRVWSCSVSGFKDVIVKLSSGPFITKVTHECR